MSKAILRRRIDHIHTVTHVSPHPVAFHILRPRQILAPYLSTRVHDAAARAGIRKRGLLLAFLLSTPWAGLSLERGALAMGAGVLILEAAILAGYYWRRTRGLLTVLAAR